MDFTPIPSKLEEAIIEQVDKLIPSTDRSMNTLLKMALLNDDTPEFQEKLDRVIANIKRNNYIEKTAIDQEYLMYYDASGNLVSINDIENERKEN